MRRASWTGVSTSTESCRSQGHQGLAGCHARDGAHYGRGWQAPCAPPPTAAGNPELVDSGWECDARSLTGRHQPAAFGWGAETLRSAHDLQDAWGMDRTHVVLLVPCRARPCRGPPCAGSS